MRPKALLLNQIVNNIVSDIVYDVQQPKTPSNINISILKKIQPEKQKPKKQYKKRIPKEIIKFESILEPEIVSEVVSEIITEEIKPVMVSQDVIENKEPEIVELIDLEDKQIYKLEQYIDIPNRPKFKQCQCGWFGITNKINCIICNKNL